LFQLVIVVLVNQIKAVVTYQLQNLLSLRILNCSVCHLWHNFSRYLHIVSIRRFWPTLGRVFRVLLATTR